MPKVYTGFGPPPPPPLTPDAAITRQNSETLERELIFGMFRHYRFYREMRDRICLYDPNTTLYKQDFSIARYNTLYQAIDAYWRRFDSAPGWDDIDVGIPIQKLAAYIIDWGNAKMIPSDVCVRLSQEIIDETPLIDSITLEACRALAQSAGFAEWLRGRAMDHAVRVLRFRMEKGGLDLEALKGITKTAETSAVTQKRRWVNAGAVAAGTQKWSKAIPTTLTALNAALGGGFRKGQAWLIAAAPGGGKTVMANQLLWEFAEAGRNVVSVTTEQKPHELIPRIISNAAQIPIINLQEALDRSMLEATEADDVPIIPASYRENPAKRDRINEILEILGQRVLFSNWTEGDKCSIVADLAPEIEAIKNETSWEPDVIIFDWLGGALESADRPEKIRFIYQEAADSFVDYCRRTNVVGIMFAQVNQVMARNQQRVTMAMLAESKACVNRMHGFIGISSLQEPVDLTAGVLTPRLQTYQWLNVDKGRTSQAGLAKVKQEFAFQRYQNIDTRTSTGE
jgi:KaiC/GvpD/RAD55 family RecA-like ATPase/antitoxin component HigA of HigAB toxin-antitoxin module